MFPFRSHEATIAFRTVKPWQVIMYGRFVLKAPFSELVRLYNVTNNVNLEPRYNISPTEPVAVVRSRERKRTLDMLRWRLVPWWSREMLERYSVIELRMQ
jgi:putative SOS response-associated peptidase YedK